MPASKRRRARSPLARCAALLLALASSGCPELPWGAEEPALDARVQREAQLASLSSVYYRGGPMPPAAGADELAALERALAAAPEPEREELAEYYRDERDLLAFATRDRDGDGVRDYRVSDFYGKFLEGDVDVDQDGVRNLHDAAPYDPATGGSDANANGVPDHVDWRLQGRSAAAAARQEALLREHGILLVERSAPFPDTLVRSVHDAVTRLFRGPLAGAKGMPSLRTIASEETCLLLPEVDDETNALAIRQTQSLSIFRIGIDTPPLVQLGLVAHELGHSYEFSLDFDPVGENARFYFPAPRFQALLAAFGWRPEPIDFDPATDGYRAYTPQYFELEPSYKFQGRAPEAWADWLTELSERHGEAFLEQPEVVALHVLGDYSLSDPWEWYSDSLLAYLFVELERYVQRTRPAAVSARASAAIASASSEAWPGFRYQNLDPGPVHEHFRRTFPLREDDLAYLVETYVLPLLEETTSSPATSSPPAMD